MPASDACSFVSWLIPAAASRPVANAAARAILCALSLALAAWPASAAPPVPSQPTASCDATVSGQCYVDGSFSLSSFSSGADHHQVCRSNDTTGFGGCGVVMTTHTGPTFTVSGSHLPSDGFRRAYYFRACDAGNDCTRWADSTPRYVYRDVSPPSTPGATSTACLHQSSGCWVRHGFTISASAASDGGSGVGAYEICRSQDSTGGFAGCSVFMTTSGGTSFAVSGSHLPPDGFRRAYRFRARDRVGNTGEWNSPLYVRVDRHNPAVSASNASSSWFASRSLTISAADAGGGSAANSGLAQVRYRWNAVHNGSCTSGTATSNGAPIEAPAGDNRLYLCARDHTDRVGFWDGRYRVDATAPQPGSVTTSSATWAVDDGSTYSLTATATDSRSGVSDLRLQINRAGGNAANPRGIFAWRSSGHVWSADRVACAGGGFASKHPTTANPGTVTLVGCTSSLSGNSRTVTLTVLPNASFGEFGPINDVSLRARDAVGHWSSWQAYDLNFATEINDPPVAVDDTAATPEDTAVTIQVTANDLFTDGPQLKLVGAGVVTAPSHGTAVKLSGTSIGYTPAANFVGTDTFEYEIGDGAGLRDRGRVTVTVSGVNDPPSAVADAAAAAPEVAVTIQVTANDSDLDGDAVSLVASPIVSGPSHGTAQRVSSSSLSYTAERFFTGTDTFEYEISDGQGGFDRAAVSVTVTNAKPVAVADVASAAPEVATTIEVTANDSDPDGQPVKVAADAIVSPPSHGTAQRASPTSVTYTADVGYEGSDSFEYKITDGNGRLDTATVTVTVSNRLPEAVVDAAQTHVNTPVTIAVTANDSDPDGHSVSVVDAAIVTPPLHGTAVRASGSSLTYTPEDLFLGVDSFVYEIVDGNGGRDRATVTVTVTNNPPVAMDDAKTTDFEREISIQVTANDSDPDGDTPRLLGSPIVTPPLHGTAVRGDSTRIRYTPAPEFSGVDTFVYEVADGFGLTDTATVTVTVLEKARIDSVTPDIIRRGTFATLTLSGSNLQGGTVSIATEPFDEASPLRVYPTVELLSANGAGTQMTVRVDATDAALEGFYNLVVDGPGGVAGAPFRVVGPEPEVDFWTPSQPVPGKLHVLSIVGVNLAGAEVLPSDPGIRILDLDNSDDRALHGLLFIADGLPPQGSELQVAGGGGSVMLPLSPVPDPLQATQKTSTIAAGPADGSGSAPELLLQQPVSPHFSDDSPGGFGRSAPAMHGGGVNKMGLCVGTGIKKRIDVTAVLFSLTDNQDNPLLLDALNALLPGGRLRFTTLTTSLTVFIEFEFNFQVCVDPFGGRITTDFAICVRGGITAIVPGLGGHTREFDFCIDHHTEIDIGPGGGIGSQVWSSSNACVAVADLGGVIDGQLFPGSDAGKRRAELEVRCCEPAEVSVEINGSASGEGFSVGGPVFEVRPPCRFAVFLDVDGDNPFSTETAAPLSELDDLPQYLPGSRLDGTSIADLASTPQQMHLVAAYVTNDGGGMRVLPPPSGVSGVSFILTDTSAFLGVASNWPVTGGSTAPDFHLGSGATGASQKSVSFASDHTARVDFVATDYGGFTSLEASPDGGQTRFVTRIPQDDDGNMLPDKGWKLSSGSQVAEFIVDSAMPGDDRDSVPVTSSIHPALGRTGDGLSVYEEYRGFLVRGQHRRTHPDHKDVFVSSNLATGVSYAFPNLPLAVHRVHGPDQALAMEYDADREINFNSTNSGFGGGIPGHSRQKAIRSLATTTLLICILGETFFEQPAGPLDLGTPNETEVVKIYPSEHNQTCLPLVPAAKLTNEIRRTFGHEVGHALHVCHRNCSNSTCADPVGPGPSIMNCNSFFGSNDEQDPGSQYDSADRAQIRVHVKHP